jgi:hypothetical protein
MKRLLFIFSTISIIAFSCKSTGSMATIEPKLGNIELPAKGEFRIWKDIAHPGFTVTLTNNAPNQSCEIYSVKSNGTEKWISPSLLANSTLTITVPTNGHLFFKNFNPNILIITYKVNQ